MAFSVTRVNDVAVYNLSSGASLRQYLAERQGKGVKSDPSKYSDDGFLVITVLSALYHPQSLLYHFRPQEET